MRELTERAPLKVRFRLKCPDSEPLTKRLYYPISD